MEENNHMKKSFTYVSIFVALIMVLSACAPAAEPEVIVQTVEVEKTVIETVE
jgi:hypothetical protein